MTVLWLAVFVIGIAGIVWGAETFAEHLGAASVRLGISTFALGVLLAGAEPEELATVVTASLRGSPGIAIGDVIGANVAICLVALGVGAVIAPLPFRQKVLRYALAGLPVAALACWFAWDGRVDRLEGAVPVGLYILYVAVIWFFEGRPPSLGEVEEIEEAQEKLAGSEPTPSPKDFVLGVHVAIEQKIGLRPVCGALLRICSRYKCNLAVNRCTNHRAFRKMIVC